MERTIEPEVTRTDKAVTFTYTCPACGMKNERQFQVKGKWEAELERLRKTGLCPLCRLNQSEVSEMNLKDIKAGQRFALKVSGEVNGLNLEMHGLFFVLDFTRKKNKNRDVTYIGLVSCNGSNSLIVDAGKLQPKGNGFILPADSLGQTGGGLSLEMTPAPGRGPGAEYNPEPPEPLCLDLDGPLPEPSGKKG